jgi:copper resistance protein B
MRTELFATMLCALLMLSHKSYAAEMAHDHGGGIYHMFRLEADSGISKGDVINQWDVKGWIGNDTDKLYLRTEGAHTQGSIEDAELWALYSRNIATFWDAQAGIRYDVQPDTTPYLTVGVDGLAPHFFETEAHLFISNKGKVSARLHVENDLLLTQQLIAQPYLELNLAVQDVPKRESGSGLVDGEFGIKTRYEFTRAFAPYLDLRYERSFGETASIAKTNGEDINAFVTAIGLQLMF